MASKCTPLYVHVICCTGCYSAATMAAFTLCVAIISNAYLMSPRIILQSVANLPLFVFLHMFIILMGVCVSVCIRIYVHVCACECRYVCMLVVCVHGCVCPHVCVYTNGEMDCIAI